MKILIYSSPSVKWETFESLPCIESFRVKGTSRINLSLLTVRKMDLILRSIQRKLQMQLFILYGP